MFAAQNVLRNTVEYILKTNRVQYITLLRILAAMSLLAQLAMQLAVRIVSSGHHGGVTFYTAYAKPLE